MDRVAELALARYRYSLSECRTDHERKCVEVEVAQLVLELAALVPLMTVSVGQPPVSCLAHGRSDAHEPCGAPPAFLEPR